MVEGIEPHGAGRCASRAAGPLVVKLGGAAVEGGVGSDDLLGSIARAHASRRCGGVVVVHGGGKVVDRRLARLGIRSERREGVRITTPDQIDEVVATLAGLVNTMVVGRLCAMGAPAIGLRIGDAGVTHTVKVKANGFDPGLVGRVAGGDCAALRALLDAGLLPVLSSIGLDDAGRALNVNADDAAAGVACALGARALVLLTDTPGILDASGRTLAHLDGDEVEALIAGGVIGNGMIPKARGAALAASFAGAPAVIADGADVEALDRIAAGESVGTLVTPSLAVAAPPREMAGVVA